MRSWNAFRVLKRLCKIHISANRQIERLALVMANTKSITDTAERKKVKRAARKAAAPKGPRTGARGENKAKIKKAALGKSKR